MMNNTVYLIIALFYILQLAKSKKQNTRELKSNTEKILNAVDKINMTKFVEMLIQDAEKKAMKQNKPATASNSNLKKETYQRPETKKTKKISEQDGFENNYDTLNLDEEKVDKIVRSHTDDEDMKKMEQIIRTEKEGVDIDKLARILQSNNAGIDYDEIRQLLRSSNAGIDVKRKKIRPHARSKGGSVEDLKGDQIFRSIKRRSEEDEGTGLVFDLEDDDVLTHPLF